MEDISKKITGFKRLLNMDKVVCSNVAKIARTVFTSDNLMSDMVEKVSVAGSSGEGALLARWFLPDLKYQDGVHAEVECDIDLNIFKIPEHKKSCVRDVAGKPGFARVFVEDKTDICNILKFVNRYIVIETRDHVAYREDDLLGQRSILKAKKLQEILLKAASGNYTVNAFGKFINQHLRSQQLSFSRPTDNKKTTKASVESIFYVKFDGQLIGCCSWDTVLTIELGWWPNVAQEWISRERNYPSESEIGKLTKKCHLIVKPYNDHVDDVFRYSFVSVEKELANMRSEHQKLIYMIFKAMFYKWLKPINPEEISSYLGKTVMLWVTEETGTDLVFWQESSENISEIIRYLFHRLKEMLERKVVPFYFISQINVMEKMSENVRVQVVKKIAEILNDIPGHFPDPNFICEKFKTVGYYAVFMQLLKPQAEQQNKDILKFFDHTLADLAAI